MPPDEPSNSAQTPADAELMRELAAGRMEALAALVRRHQHSVRAIAWRMTGREDAADDITQETFLRVYRSAGSYRPTAAFTTWLYRIVVNLCLDRARAPRMVDLPEDAPAPETADGPLLRAERLEAVRKAVAALPERQRIAVILHRFEGLSHAQIAAATGWSEPAVESLLTRAYETLRAALEQWHTG